MVLEETTEQGILERLNDAQEREAIFLFTPMCGTCQIGEKMLEVVQATGKGIPLLKLNINYAPHLREKWQIESVPAVVIIQGGVLLYKQYAMHGVDVLYELLRRDKLYGVLGPLDNS